MIVSLSVSLSTSVGIVDRMARYSNRPINFGAGPSKIAEEVIQEARDELFDFNNTGISIMELSHHSQQYQGMVRETEDLMRDLVGIPSNYKILFADGGSSGQFAAVPMNLISRSGKADYVNTGFWSDHASTEAEKYGNIKKIQAFDRISGRITDSKTWSLDPDASYLHICANETITGVQFPSFPETNGVPLVADMCSEIFSRPIDITKFGVIYGAAYKTVGTAGVCIIIARDDLLNNELPITPKVFNWNRLQDLFNLYHTPPSFPIYILNKKLKWVKKQGGLEQMLKNAEERSKLIYDAIDESNGFYVNSVDREFRSRNNVAFQFGDGGRAEELEELFVGGAAEEGMVNLRGHRTFGGIRVSMYNAMDVTHAEKLANYMKIFQRKNN